MPTNKIVLLAFILIAIITWNYWLPSALSYFNDRNPADPQYNMDFYAYYTAGKSYAQGLDAYRDNGGKLADPNYRKDGYSRYLYPPTMLPVFSLLGNFNFDVARVIWMVMYLTIHMFIILAIALQTQNLKHGLIVVLGVLLTITSQPLLYHIRQGQINLLLMSLVVASFLVRQANHKFISALLLAIATLTKLNPVMFLITFVVYMWDLRYLLYFVIIMIGLTLSSLLVVPLGLYKEYLTVILPTFIGGSSFYSNQSIIRLISSSTNLAHIVTIAGFGIFTLFAGIIGKKYSNNKYLSSLYAKGMLFMNCLVILLFSSLTWEMTFVWIILPATLFLGDLIPIARMRFLGMIGAGIVLLNSYILPFPVLNSLNMIGGIFTLFCLVILFCKPILAIQMPEDPAFSN